MLLLLAQAQVIAQGVEQRHVRLRLDGVVLAIDVEFDAFGHVVLPRLLGPYALVLDCPRTSDRIRLTPTGRRAVQLAAVYPRSKVA